jgi:Mce-associated membrane protein
MRRYAPHPLTALLVLVLVGVGVLVWLFVSRPDPHAGRAADDAALAAARQTSVNSASYDYRSIDKQLKIIDGELTGPALTQFNAQKSDIKTSVTTNKTVATAQVLDSALVPGAVTTGGTVRALVALDVTYVVNSGTPATQPQLLEVDMVRMGEGWVAENISPVTPSAS